MTPLGGSRSGLLGTTMTVKNFRLLNRKSGMLYQVRFGFPSRHIKKIPIGRFFSPLPLDFFVFVLILSHGGLGRALIRENNGRKRVSAANFPNLGLKCWPGLEYDFRQRPWPFRPVVGPDRLIN
jgi:hypothetical protein